MDELRGWLDERVAGHEFSGAVLAKRGDEPVFSYAGGIAHRGHGVPVAADTRFAVASVTKMITAVAVLRLVERGLVGLRDPLPDVLPAEHRPTALTGDHTLHHLLSHTSGLTNYHDDDDETSRSWFACWDRIPTYRARRPADLLPLFATLPAAFPPGERYSYSDANFILAALVIEAVTGRPYNDVVADEVLTPAGMADSSFAALDEEPDRLATGYRVSDEPYERWLSNIYGITASPMPDGGMITTAADMVGFLDALRADRLVSAETRAVMTTPRVMATHRYGYGYGMEIVLAGEEVAVFGHDGGDPGVSAIAVHLPAAETTVAVLCNHDRGAWPAYLRVLAALDLQDPRG
jgi:CubicO group peptidase (beta-lactamase class C family)